MLQLDSSVDFIQKKTGLKPKIAVILGSGLGNFIDDYAVLSIPYSEIPGFPKAHVQGHKGNLVFADIKGKHVLAMQGRFHYYEGHDLAHVVYPLEVFQKLGVETLIVTNAAGCINTSFHVGDLMIIADHINFMGVNPLRSMQPVLGRTSFVDLTEAYDHQLNDYAEEVAQKLQLTLRKGVYAAMSGPSYETPAEVRMLQKLGADAVGMSTVPEVIMANYLNIKVLGISCLTNMAAGLSSHKLNHQEVIDTSNRAKEYFSTLLYKIITECPQFS